MVHRAEALGELLEHRLGQPVDGIAPAAIEQLVLGQGALRAADRRVHAEGLAGPAPGADNLRRQPDRLDAVLDVGEPGAIDDLAALHQE